MRFNVVLATEIAHNNNLSLIQFANALNTVYVNYEAAECNAIFFIYCISINKT